MAELYEPGNYECEIMDYEFTQVEKKDGPLCPALRVYVYPQVYQNDPKAGLPNPGSFFPRADIILWDETDDSIAKFTQSLYACGFKGGDIATMVEGTSSFSDDLRGNKVSCYRKAKAYVNKKTGEAYDQWGISTPRDENSKGKADTVRPSEAIERLRAVLNPRLQVLDMPSPATIAVTDTPF